MGKKLGISFSWKRALGISSLKGKISRATGVPLTRSGRQRRIGRTAGCMVMLAIAGAGSALPSGALIRNRRATGPSPMSRRSAEDQGHVEDQHYQADSGAASRRPIDQRPR